MGNSRLTWSFVGGAEGTRTPDPLHAMQVRYQLRHSPKAATSLQAADQLIFGLDASYDATRRQSGDEDEDQPKR
jgi:hypothetical protein